MSKLEANEGEVVIEDFDQRCQATFRPSGERCWNLAIKIVKIGRRQTAICLAHYEEWLASLADLKKVK